MSNEPLSEQYRKASLEWIELEKAASLLEECKSTSLAERKNALIKANPNMADNAAEREAKASPEWRTYVTDMVEARSKANKAKLKLKWLDMRFSEWVSDKATERTVVKLG